MVSRENTNWIYDYGLIDGTTTTTTTTTTAVPVGDFFPPARGSSCLMQEALNGSSSNPSMERDGSLADSDGHKETGSKKRGRGESCNGTSSKACREKLRRDKLNDKFVELASVLEHDGLPKTDKAAILVDAVRMVTQLKNDAQKLKGSNSDIQEKIKELKSEKNELRDKKQRLKAEKEKLEQQVTSINTPPAAYSAAMSATHSQSMGNKLVPVISYPGMAMWQFMPPGDMDTSQDHTLHPPVA